MRVGRPPAGPGVGPCRGAGEGRGEGAAGLPYEVWVHGGQEGSSTASTEEAQGPAQEGRLDSRLCWSNQTGLVDAETVSFMETPRCGVRDK